VSSSSTSELPEDPGAALLRGLVKELLRRLEDPAIAKDMTAAEFTCIRQICADNSISFASIKRGDFGVIAQKVAEEFPFPEGPSMPSASNSMN